MRRPLNEPVRVTGDRASHAEYGVGPATDYGCGIGTPVYAPFSGRLSRYTTTEGGLGVILWGADAAFYGQHLSSQGAPGDYDEGDEIALSGNSGRNILDPSVPYDPHLHCYVIIHATGERLAMEEYLALNQPAPTGTPSQSQTERRRADMRVIRQATPGQTYYQGWALIGETTYQLNPADTDLANEWGRVWNGKSGLWDDVTSSEFHRAIAGVNARRSMIGLGALPLPR